MGRKKKNNETICHCMLIQAEVSMKCSRTMEECERCGWNPSVHEARKEWINTHGLTLCDDGLKRLIMPKKEKENRLAELFIGGL